MRNVLLLSASAKPGGAEQGLRTLAHDLPAQGWQPVPVVLEDGPLREWLGPGTILVEAGRTRQLHRTAAAVRELARLVREHDAEVVVSSLSKSHVYGGCAAALAGVPAVWWQQGIPHRSRVDLAASAVPAAAVVCLSEAAAAAQRRLRPARPVVVVNHGVGPRRADPAAARALRAELAPGGERLVGIVGRLEPWKGQELFLRAAALLATGGEPLRFVVVGGALLGWEGDYPDRLRRLASELGIADRVHFAGHQDDVAPWYEALDVVVHASTAEPFGLVLLEAMAHGRPLVSASRGAAPEIVEDGRSGLLAPTRDPEVLAGAVARILEDPALAARLSAGARARAAEFTPERAAAEFAAVLDAVAAAGRRSAPRLPRSAPLPLVLGMGWFPDQPGGLNRYVRGLLGALPEARGVVLGPCADAPSRVIAGGDAADRLLLRLLRFRRAAISAAAGADVLDAHFALTALPVLRRLRRLPLVVHFHGPWADEGRTEGAGRLAVAAKAAVERRVYRRARRVVTLSHAFAELMAERYGVERGRIEVVPPGVDLDRFSPGDRHAARELLGLDDGVFVVAVARRLVRRMGVDVLLEAWREVERRRPGATLLIAGDGPERAHLERAAPASVRFLGRISDDELVALYRAADASVLPTVALEGFGLAAAEALACGTPTVVTRVGGLPEVVGGLDPTLAVEAGDADALARRLLEPLPPRTACRAHAERFSWSATAERTRAILRAAARPRVVFLDHTAVLSGGELALLRTLPELAVDAHVVLATDGPFARQLRERGVAVEILPLAEHTRDLPRERAVADLPRRATTSIAYALRLARRLRELRPDVVHANSLKSALYGGVAGRLAGVPVVWHVRDRIAPDYLPRSVVLLVRLAARVLPTAIVANSPSTLATLPQRRRAFVVPSPVAIDARSPAAANGALHVGIVGRLAPWKGQHVFLDAFARAFGDGGARAHVIGAPLFGADEEEYERGLHARARELGIASRVEFSGFAEDVAGELARLDLLVHASTLPEPFGQVVVEGMAAGLPVVAAAAGGPADVVAHGENGLLYPPADVDALADAMRTLARDPELRRRLGEAGRRTAEAYTPARVARELERVYGSVR